MEDVVLNHIDMEFLSIPENVSIARLTVALAASCGNMTVSALEEIKVAVSEAVSNSIIHGYHGRSEGIVSLSFKQYADYIEITVSDRGCGIADVEQAMQPTYSSMEQRMGLGFAFMKSFMDSLTVNSLLGIGTTVIMTKRVVKAEESEDGDRCAELKLRA